MPNKPHPDKPGLDHKPVDPGKPDDAGRPPQTEDDSGGTPPPPSPPPGHQ